MKAIPIALSPTRSRAVIHNGVVTTVATSATKVPSLYEQARDVLAAIDAVTHDDIKAIAAEILTRPKVLAVVGPYDDADAFSSALS